MVRVVSYWMDMPELRWQVSRMDYDGLLARYEELEAEFTRLAVAIVDLPSNDPDAAASRARLAQIEEEIQSIIDEAGPHVCFLPCCNPHPGDMPKESDEAEEFGVVLQGNFGR